MKLKDFGEKWNLLFALAAAILVPVFGFVDYPYYALAALSANSNLELLARFVVAIIIAIMIIPCSLFNKRMYAKAWGIATFLLLVASLFILFKSISIKHEKTVDYSSYNGGFVVKGDHLLDSAKKLITLIEKEKKGAVSESEFFASHRGDL